MITAASLPDSRRRTVLAFGALVAAAALASACGSTTSTPGSVSVPTVPGGTVASPSATPGPTSGNLGDTLTMEDGVGNIAHVTMLQVFDPATLIDPSDMPPEGTRWVGFEGTIVVDGSGSGQEDTSVEVIGSDGQTYGADTALAITPFDGCTATPDDASELPPGTTQTFCPGVPLPPGVTVSKIGYSTQGVSGNAPAVLFWTVSDTSTATPTATPSASPDTTPTPDTTPSPSASPDDATPSASPTATPAA